jgi:hypothetical protein
MTVKELRRLLKQLPPNAEVRIARDWGRPVLHTEYLLLPGNPTVAIRSHKDPW